MGRKKNRKQQQNEVVGNATDTEFGSEVPQSKKARKRAAREAKNS